MRLGKKFKFNMIIAILLCMAFVVNLGSTLATIDYSFKTSSINNVEPTLEYDTYVDFASAEGTKGKYTYSPGTYNNQLSINYGFKQSYDLMVRFTATYSNTSYYQTTKDSEGNFLTTRKHIANDFSLNFVNRDNWIVDMGSKEDWITGGEQDQIYYTTTSKDSSTISGVMYYMNTLTDSGSLPIISGVTFHTSPNNSYEFIGDTLTVTLEPCYVKVDSGKYSTAKHEFYSTEKDEYGFSQNSTLFTKWATYMKEKGEGTTANNSTFMIYNSYVDYERSIQFPYDYAVMEQDLEGKLTTGEVKPTNSQPTYSNTAHRYEIVEGGRNYNAITAGNKYHGGLGVYVIPNSSLLTISITVDAFWCKENISLDTTQIGIVSLGYSSEIQEIINGTSYYYYKAKITKPTYINVLDYIMLTAESYSTYILNDYRLILNNISVNLISNENNIIKADTSIENNVDWDENTVLPTYDIHNSTKSSPVLVRVKDVITGFKTYETDISITNNNKEPLAISGFSISSELWYGLYTDKEIDGKTVKVFKKTAMGSGYLADGGLIYNTTMWTQTKCENGVFTFINNSGVTYIPSGYTMTLISGVKIPATAECQADGQANDFWCSLEIIDTQLEVDRVNVGTAIYTNDSSDAVEVIVEGDYSIINSSNPGYIYVRNNTNQIITGISLTNLNVLEFVQNKDFLLRESTGDVLSEEDYDLVKHLTEPLSIKPGEMVLAYTIIPKDIEVADVMVKVDAVITNFNLTATLNGQKDTQDVNLIYNQDNQNGVLINNGTSYYEFRLVSDTDLTDILTDKDKFIEHEINNKYYYYYKGVICPNICLDMFKSYAKNVVVQQLEHKLNVGIARYQYLTNNELDTAKLATVVANFADTQQQTRWGIVSSDVVQELEGKNQYQWFAGWLDAMIKLYDEPSKTDRTNASIVERATNKITTYDTRFTIVPFEHEGLEVVDGDSFTFTIQLNDGYQFGSTVILTANDEELIATEGKYTITSVTDDIEISIEGIEVIQDAGE